MHFDERNGLRDNQIESLAVDQQGRLWVGYLNQGVGVWNGREWGHYSLLDGPLGEHVWDIAVCPTDGSVWMATSGGISRYLPDADRWLYYGRAEGLASEQVSSLTFDRQGNAYAGLQTEGIAIGSVAEGYRAWRQIPVAPRLPLKVAGQDPALPTGLVNDVLVCRTGRICVATNFGLAASTDGGKTWDWMRGQDWEAKVRERFLGAPKGWKAGPGAALDEDYITTLEEDSRGRLWVGYRSAGWAVFDTQGAKVLTSKSDPAPDGDYLRAVFFPEGESPLFAWYGAGLTQGDLAGDTPGASEARTSSQGAVGDSALTGSTTRDTVTGAVSQPTTAGDETPVSLPSAALPPLPADMERYLKKIAFSSGSLAPGMAEYLGDDWSTAGDWVGRYGRQYAILWAVSSPFNDEMVNDEAFLDAARAQLGPHPQQDVIRHWIHWDETKNPNTLYKPSHGLRRQAEIDDHGETYSMNYEGPDLWITLRVPAGLHRVSLYFFNKDGHEGNNRFRDYLIDVKPYREKSGEDAQQRRGLSPPAKSGPLEDLVAAEQEPSLARSRVQHFYSGVYKQFAFQGPSSFLIKIAKNYSYNTICSGLFVDALGNGMASTRQAGIREPSLMGLGGLNYAAPAYWLDPATQSRPLRTAASLWEASSKASLGRDALRSQRAYRLLAYRAAQAARLEGTPDALYEHWRWKVPLWNPSDRQAFRSAMTLAWEEQKKRNASLKSVIYPARTKPD
jgi:hypothetical protein